MNYTGIAIFIVEAILAFITGCVAASQIVFWMKKPTYLNRALIALSVSVLTCTAFICAITIQQSYPIVAGGRVALGAATPLLALSILATAMLAKSRGKSPASEILNTLKQESVLMKIGLALFPIALINAVTFFSWRWDQPAHNPGGPLLPIGLPAILWEASTTTLFSISTILLVIAITTRDVARNRTLNAEENALNSPQAQRI